MEMYQGMFDEFAYNRKRYFFFFITLITFMHVMRPLKNAEFTVESFVDDQSIKDLIANNNCFVPKSLKAIDWHDRNLLRYERKRKGLGEHGRPAYLNNNDAEATYNSYFLHGLNGEVSNKISLIRSLPDVRLPECMKKKYIESLPSVSVIIPFYNEHLNTLLRTVRSVIRRSPPQLLKEILLINDGSTLDDLHDNVESYLKKYKNKVKLMKLSVHNGVIRAKLNGAKEATGDVLVFLDSHCEVNVNWLPPLLEPVALNYHTVMCPVIDNIKYSTFKYTATREYRGSFDWSFNFKEAPLTSEEQNKLPEPYANPVMNGIFAISRMFFWELGGFDPGLFIWGGDHYEMSFKIWLCGGNILTAPCSRVGHVKHKSDFYYLKYGYGDFIRKNYRRIADVWLDNYAQKLYRGDPNYNRVDPGDTSKQKALREKLQCKPFRWYLSKVAGHLEILSNVDDTDNFPYAQGQVKPLWETNICVNANYTAKQLFLLKCDIKRSKEQFFVFTNNKAIKSKERNVCWDLPDSTPKRPILLDECYYAEYNQLWWYDMATLQIMQGNKNCLDWDHLKLKLFIKPCDNSSTTQQWEVDYNNLFEYKSL